MKRLAAIAVCFLAAALLGPAAPCAGQEPKGSGDQEAGAEPAEPEKAPPAEKAPESGAPAKEEPAKKAGAPEAGRPGEAKPAGGMEEREEAAPSPDTLDAAILLEPLRGGRNSFLHSLLGLPSLSAGLGLPSNTGAAWLSLEVTRCGGLDEAGAEFDATHVEGVFGVRYAVSEMVEFHGAACGAILGGDVALTWMGTPMVPAERDEQARISRFLIGTKVNLLPLGEGAPDLWVSLDFKLSATDKDLADSGRPAVAFTFHLTQAIGPVWAHLNLGWFLSDGQQVFPSVPTGPYASESIRTLRVFHWGLALVLPLADRASVILQTVGNTNAFRDLNVLDSDAHVLMLGGRYAHGALSIELSGGLGLSDASADWMARLEIGVLFGGRRAAD
jgi:hypothetical protein